MRAFFNALILAGYKVEMDDDGDIWFDMDDYEPYLDALEHLPKPEERGIGSSALVCPICRDPERHGLGYIIRRVEEGRRIWAEHVRREGMPQLTALSGMAWHNERWNDM